MSYRAGSNSAARLYPKNKGASTMPLAAYSISANVPTSLGGAKVPAHQAELTIAGHWNKHDCQGCRVVRAETDDPCLSNQIVRHAQTNDPRAAPHVRLGSTSEVPRTKLNVRFWRYSGSSLAESRHHSMGSEGVDGSLSAAPVQPSSSSLLHTQILIFLKRTCH